MYTHDEVLYQVTDKCWDQITLALQPVSTFFLLSAVLPALVSMTNAFYFSNQLQLKPQSLHTYAPRGAEVKKYYIFMSTLITPSVRSHSYRESDNQIN